MISVGVFASCCKKGCTNSLFIEKEPQLVERSGYSQERRYSTVEEPIDKTVTDRILKNAIKPLLEKGWLSIVASDGSEERQYTLCPDCATELIDSLNWEQ